MASERNIQFQIKRPSKVRKKGNRSSFALQKITYINSSRVVTTVKDNRIDVINRKFHDNETTYEQADQLMAEIRDQLKQVEVELAIPVHNAENLAILDKFWEEDYQYRSVISPETMRVGV